MQRGATATVSGAPALSRGPGKPSAAIVLSPSLMRDCGSGLEGRYDRVLAAAMEAVASRPAVRARKVRGVRERIRRGRYAPTAAAIARRLVGV